MNLKVGEILFCLVENCKFSVTADDIKVADALLLRFCKRSAQLYGSDMITPNMHIHCHLTACVKEFGPLHSFWLFLFERYNGILEGQQTIAQLKYS